jgi:hypothetical protein
MEYGQMTINKVGTQTPVLGDQVFHNGTTYETLGAGENEGHYSLIAIRNAADAAGDVAYTGVGFKPKALWVMTGLATSKYFGVGIGLESAGPSRGFSFATNDDQFADTWDGGGTTVARKLMGGSTSTSAVLKSKDSDGFTLTWSKAGSPTGNIYIWVWCLR